MKVDDFYAGYAVVWLTGLPAQLSCALFKRKVDAEKFQMARGGEIYRSLGDGTLQRT